MLWQPGPFLADAGPPQSVGPGATAPSPGQPWKQLTKIKIWSSPTKQTKKTEIWKTDKWQKHINWLELKF